MSNTRKPLKGLDKDKFLQAYYHPNALPEDVLKKLTRGKSITFFAEANQPEANLPANRTRSKIVIR